jgi:hypothetical protein
MGGVRFKQIEYSGQKKIYFLPYNIYFSVNRGGARAPAGAYLRSAHVGHGPIHGHGSVRDELDRTVHFKTLQRLHPSLGPIDKVKV